MSVEINRFHTDGSDVIFCLKVAFIALHMDAAYRDAYSIDYNKAFAAIRCRHTEAGLKNVIKARMGEGFL